MKSCWLYRGSIRNFIEGEGALSAAAELHVRKCAECAAQIETHLEVLRSLRRKPAQPEAPFLRARILNSLEREPARVERRPALAFAFVAVAACVVFVVTRGRSPQAEAPTFAFEKPEIFARGNFQTPYEKELANLRADTTNAIRALAASFIPAASSLDDRQ